MNRFTIDLVTFALIVRSWRDIWRDPSIRFMAVLGSLNPWRVRLMQVIEETPTITPMAFTVTVTRPLEWTKEGESR